MKSAATKCDCFALSGGSFGAHDPACPNASAAKEPYDKRERYDGFNQSGPEGRSAACSGRAVALTRFERPVGTVTGYVVACECGWKSRITTDWRRSLDGHYYREEAKRAAERV